MKTAFAEFNDKTLLDRMDTDQKSFNAYVEPKSQNPDEDWQWNGVRPITRNKIISMAAHLTSSILYPQVFAQNDKDEEDKDAALVMDDLIEYNCRNSEYETSFLFAVVSILVNPVTYLEEEFSEVMQIIKEKNESGEITKKEIIDEIFSGFQVYNVPADEILIANVYEYELQKQRFLIRRRDVDYADVKAKYGEHSNFKYIRPGINTFYNKETNLFYDATDENKDTLIEEVIYYNRREDLEVPYVNGIYMGKSNPDANLMKHRDHKDRPKYRYVKTGAEPIDEKRFFFYKSIAFKMIDDQNLADEMYRILINATTLETIPPVAGIGAKLDQGVMYPGAVTEIKEGAKIEAIGIGRNLTFMDRLLDRVEKNLSEESVDVIVQGQATQGNRTAYEIARQERNARLSLGVIGRMLTAFVKDFGELMIEDIIRHQTVGEVEELLGGEIQMKFRTFLLPDKSKKGKKITKKIQFTNELANKEYTEDQILEESFNRLEEGGGIDSEMEVYKVNPELFSKIKFKVIIEPNDLFPRNEVLERMFKQEAYELLITNPYIEVKEITKDFMLEPLVKGDTDKYLKKGQELGLMPQMSAVGQKQLPTVGQAMRPENLENITLGQ